MSIKISSNAGHSNPPGDPGACGSAQSKPILNGQTEAILNRNMNAAFIEMGLRRGYEMHDGTQANGSTANQAAGANSFGAILAVSHHFNGAVNPAASGALICVHKNTSAANKAFAKELAAAISAAFGIPNLGIQERADLNFLNRTYMAALLIEWGFTSSPSDMQKILANGMAGIRAVWDVIEKHYPVAKPVETKPAQTAPAVAIMGKAAISAETMAAFVRTRNRNFDAEIARQFLAQGQKYGIRGDIAFCQSIHETGWFLYGGDVKDWQHNYAGIGAVGGGAKGAVFMTVAEGVKAQVQHLYAYACRDALPAGEKLIDPRFDLVTRGIAPNWTDLNGRWAVPGATYGESILKLYDELVSFKPAVQDEQGKADAVSDPKQSAEYKELMSEYVAVNAAYEELRAAHNILATKYENLNKDLDALAGKY